MTKTNIDEVLDKALDLIADEIFSLSQENIIKNGSFDQGTLLRSGNVIRNKLEKQIVYSVPYAVAVEFGSAPHMPPVDPLIGWVGRKLGKSGKEGKSIGWAIAKKIQKEGQIARPFLRPALEQIMAQRTLNAK